MTRPDRTVLCLSYNGMECAQLPATAAYWSEWKGNRLAMLPCTLWDDVQNPRLFKGPAGYRPGRCRWIAKQNARLVHSGCWSIKVVPLSQPGNTKAAGWWMCGPSPCGFRQFTLYHAESVRNSAKQCFYWLLPEFSAPSPQLCADGIRGSGPLVGDRQWSPNAHHGRTVGKGSRNP